MRRDYRQFCSVARALNLVGERWTLLIVRELLLGPRRYGDLLQALPGVGTNLLADRLKTLEADGIVRRNVLPPPAGSRVYELTERGRALEPVVVEMARWGLELLERPRGLDHYQASWSPIVMRATFRPDLARDVYESYEFRIGEEVFHARVDDGAMTSAIGPASDPACVLETDLEMFEALVTGELEPFATETAGRLFISGDHSAFRRCLGIFGLQHRRAEHASSEPSPAAAAGRGRGTR